jgi:hypothetical protein
MKKLLIAAGLIVSLNAFADNAALAPQTPVSAVATTTPVTSTQNLSASAKYHVAAPRMAVCLYADLAYSEGAVLYAENGTNYKCVAVQDAMTWQEMSKTK